MKPTEVLIQSDSGLLAIVVRALTEPYEVTPGVLAVACEEVIERHSLARLNELTSRDPWYDNADRVADGQDPF